MFRRSLALCLAGLGLSAGPAVAQTSSTFISTASANWSSAAAWQGGIIPDAGGVATFNDQTGQTAGVTVTVDSNRTLSGITLSTAFGNTYTASGGAVINVAAGGFTLNAANTLISSPTGFFTTTNPFAVPFAGAGDFIKTGFGAVSLTATNTFTGTVRLNQGTLWLNNATNDLALGNAANPLVFDGGTLGLNTSALTTSRAVTVNAGGGTLRTFTAATLNGPLSGAGTLVKQIGNAGLTLTADSSAFTGGLRNDSGTVTLSGAGRLGTGAAVESGGTVTLDNGTTNQADRLRGRAVNSRGSAFNLIGNAAAASTETAGQLTLLQGNTFIGLTPNATTPQATVLTFAGLTRQNNATMFVRGAGLGGPLANGVSNVVFTASPGTLVGAGGDPTTSTTASVLPFAFANLSTATSAGSTHLTWDAGTGRLIPLDATTGYLQDALTTATANDNVNLGATADVALAGATTVNALRLAPAGNITISGGQLTVTSGSILNTSTAATAPAVTISAPLTAGSRELLLVSTNGVAATSTGLVVSGVISGTGGLTRSGTGVAVLSGANTYTGATSFVGGTTLLSGPNQTITATGSAPSVLGQGTGAVTLAGGANSTLRVYTDGNLVFNRDIVATVGSGTSSGLGTAGLTANESFVLNGNLTVTDPNPAALPAGGPAQFTNTNGLFNLEGGLVRAQAVTVNGVVSGTGGLRSAFGAYTILNSTNTYSGPTLIGTSTNQVGSGLTAQAVPDTWEVGADNAFGTGTLFWAISTPTASATVQALPNVGTVVAGNGPRTLSNPVVLVNGFATVAGSNPLTLSGPVELGGSSTNNSVITVGATSPLTISGVVSRGDLVKNGPGTLTLTANNQNAGLVSVRQGALSVAAIGDGGVFRNLGGGLNTAGYLTLSGNAPGDTGSLRYTGAGEATNRLFSLTGSGGTLDASGTGPLVLGNTGNVTQNQMPGSTAAGLTGFTVNVGQTVFATSTTNAIGLVVGSTVTGVTTTTLFPAGTTVTEVGVNYFKTSAASTNATQLTAQAIRVDPTTPGTLLPARTLTLTGSNTGQNTLAPGLINSANYPLAVAKTGAGTWVLSAANNTYTGGTTVTAGTLLVNGQTGTNSGTGPGAVTVSGSGTLGGNGRVGGAITVNTGGALAPGLPGATPGILTTGGAPTLNAGSALRVVIASGTTPGSTAASNSGGSGTQGVGSSLLDAGGNTITLSSPNVVVDVTGVTLTPNGTYSFLVARGTGVTPAGPGVTQVNVPQFTFLNNGVDVTSQFVAASSTLFVDGGTANNVYLNFSPVPEPATVLGVAGLGLAAVRLVRRRRAG